MLSIRDRQMKMQAEILGLQTTVSFQAERKNDSGLYTGGSSGSTDNSTKMRTDNQVLDLTQQKDIRCACSTDKV